MTQFPLLLPCHSIVKKFFIRNQVLCLNDKRCVFPGMREHYVCDTEVNLCYSNPCVNGGTCLRKEGGYTCQCRSGYAGQDCQLDLSSGRNDKSCNGRTGLCAPTNCTGPANFYTPLTCQLRSRSFYRGSFLTFPALRQRYRLHLKLR